jgi:hypothetical protein
MGMQQERVGLLVRMGSDLCIHCDRRKHAFLLNAFPTSIA